MLYELCNVFLTVCPLGLAGSVWFDLVVIDSPQCSSLQGNLHLEITSSSSTHCATRCMGNQKCLSFLLGESSGILKLFNKGVDLWKRYWDIIHLHKVRYAYPFTCINFGCQLNFHKVIPYKANIY